MNQLNVKGEPGWKRLWRDASRAWEKGAIHKFTPVFSYLKWSDSWRDHVSDFFFLQRRRVIGVTKCDKIE